MKILVSSGDITKETVKKCFANESRISPKEQACAQNDLDDLFIELRSNMENLESLGAIEIPGDLSSEKYVSFDDAVTSTDFLQDWCKE